MPVGQLIADRYELKDVVGTGGMASVYCAYDTLLERNVALKILHEHHGEDGDFVDRFRHEARAAAQLSHPGIVTVIDRGEADGRQFIVFEYVDGETLKDVVERAGPLPARRVIELGLEIGRAIAFAHQQGLIHRDVKPQNVLISTDGRARVTDFGIARTIDAVGRTESGTILGTSHYIAPEQARGEHVDAQTDVYSFGVVLYELLVGDVPYAGDNFVTVAMQHVNEPLPSLLERRPDCPLRLAALVERMLAKTAADRPASMDDVVEELEACLADLDSRADGDSTMILKAPAAPAPRPRQPRTRRGSRRALLLPLLLLALAAAAAAAILLTRDDDDAGADATHAGAAAGRGLVRPLRRRQGRASGARGRRHRRRPGRPTGRHRPTRTSRRPRRASAWCFDAGADRELSSLTVTTDTPGFQAEIRSGSSRTGPFETVVAASKTAGVRTTWEIDGDAGALLHALDHRPRRQRARQRGEGDLVLEARAALVALERQLDQPVEQLRVADAGGLEEARVHARRREARDRVQLVDDHLAVLADEEVDARHPLALGRDEGVDRELLHAARRLVGNPRRHDDVGAALVVLGGVVVPLRVRDDLADDGGERRRPTLPSTPHSTSVPATNSSTSTFSSCLRASATASTSSASSCAFVMPTDEPRRAGLTKTG